MRGGRILPEAAYDFWARDGRDGEVGWTRDTLAAAKADVKDWRAKLKSWQRPCIELVWSVNERKVLRLLAGRDRSKADG